MRPLSKDNSEDDSEDAAEEFVEFEGIIVILYYVVEEGNNLPGNHFV
jgi:hypothetical protein